VTSDAPPARWTPPSWLRGYSAAALRPDFVAGLTLAAYLLPAGIGDASLAGLPPEAGLYACLFPGLIFWLLCSSRHTVITVTSALSLLTGAAVADLSAGDPARPAEPAASQDSPRAARERGDRSHGATPRPPGKARGVPTPRFADAHRRAHYRALISIMPAAVWLVITGSYMSSATVGGCANWPTAIARIMNS